MENQNISVSLTVPPGRPDPAPAAPGAPLPFTGIDVALALFVAVLLLALGSLLVRFQRNPKEDR